jgi:hypothetical protein
MALQNFVKSKINSTALHDIEKTGRAPRLPASTASLLGCVAQSAKRHFSKRDVALVLFKVGGMHLEGLVSGGSVWTVGSCGRFADFGR